MKRLQNALAICQDIVIREVKHPEPTAGQERIAAPVASNATCFEVLCAVDFDHKAGCVADEVDDVGADG